mmetsp:Transcript_109316/g.260772  ORF Transcript_109316/g.260772 Transcript_109316/m.260772 type:complete len:245 (-) Transcript_109316:68-802(-)
MVRVSRLELSPLLKRARALLCDPVPFPRSSQRTEQTAGALSSRPQCQHHDPTNSGMKLRGSKVRLCAKRLPTQWLGAKAASARPAKAHHAKQLPDQIGMPPRGGAASRHRSSPTDRLAVSSKLRAFYVLVMPNVSPSHLAGRANRILRQRRLGTLAWAPQRFVVHWPRAGPLPAAAAAPRRCHPSSMQPGLRAEAIPRTWPTNQLFGSTAGSSSETSSAPRHRAPLPASAPGGREPAHHSRRTI